MEPALAKALVEFQAKVTSIPKEREASAGKFSFTYSDISSILNTIRPILAACKLTVMQHVKTIERELYLETSLIHESGASLTMLSPFHFNNFLDFQKYGAAISYMRRYSLLSILCLNSEDEMENIKEGERPIRMPVAPPKEPTLSKEQIEKLEAYFEVLPEYKKEFMDSMSSKMGIKEIKDVPAKLYDRLIESCARRANETTPF